MVIKLGDIAYDNQEQLMNTVQKKYGEDKLPSTMFFHCRNEYLAECIKKYKKMLPINDPKLKSYLWNSINVWPDKLDDVPQDIFTDEEYDFIKKRFKAAEEREALNVDNHPNLNHDIKSARIILRKPCEKDAKLYQSRLRSEGDFGTFTGMKLNRDNLSIFTPFRSPYTFMVFDRKDEKMIGLVGLYGYDHIRRMANIEWYVFKPYRGYGYAGEAITALTNRAFDRKLFEMLETTRRDIFKKHFANIEIIRAAIRVSNVASQKTALSCGFKEQYIDRRHVIVNNTTYEDCIIFDLDR